MKKTTGSFALLLSVLLILGAFAGCVKSPSEDSSPLNVGYSSFNGKFSPFFAETSYDKDAQSMTQALLLSSDRTGAIIENGIDGETVNYNGTDYTYYGISDLKVTENSNGSVYYDFTLRQDLKFSDGEAVTADDVIFSMYVLCDPTYNGTSTLVAQPIKGLDKYLAGMETFFDLISKAGRDNTDFTYWTEDIQNTFWADIDAGGKEFVRTVVEYHKENSGAVDVASAAAASGYSLSEDATEENFWKAMEEKYGGDFAALDKAEMKTESLFGFVSCYSDFSYGIQTGDSSSNIEGIQKTGDYSVRVEMTQFDASSIYQLAIPVAPLHYYGSDENYDYEANKFGFEKGNLIGIREKNEKPVGAGPYKLMSYENGVVSFEANEHYYLGAPKTKYVNFIETKNENKISGVADGSFGISAPDFDVDAVKAITEANGGTLNGQTISVKTVDKLGYGYIGINASLVSVNADGASEPSKHLRRAFATLFSAYRELAVSSYYGERAEVINYPISNTSWAAPVSTDEGYETAFSKDVNGAQIYSADMSENAKYEAALNAAIGYFEAAGYTFEDGKLTAAPVGAKLEYEILIPGDGKQDHPAYLAAVKTSEMLSRIGMKLIVTDLTNSADLWTALENTSCEMWCAGWNATADPDMYQTYFSGDKVMPAGGSNYMYGISDKELNGLIIYARSSTDYSLRKSLYKDCLDIILDWAVEVPVYQRQDAVIFSPLQVRMSSVTPDITPYYGWINEIHNIEVVPQK
ncbi:MAG: ABC transporter substrate-binding protein [Ruminococcaceae bacterium]|nr:ABC transporter substrate-binding protein [Oscillospiraceae bacterium]